jgi:hypothetical protein
VINIGAAAIPLAIAGTSLAVAGVKAARDAKKEMKEAMENVGGGATQNLEMPAPAPQKDAPDQYNRMREQQRRDRMRRGLAATIRTGGMGDTTLANLSAPSLLGGTQKTLLGQ